MSIRIKINEDSKALQLWDNIEIIFDNTLKYFENQIDNQNNSTYIPTLDQYLKMQRIYKNIRKKLMNLKNSSIEILNDLKLNIQNRENENLIIQNGIENLQKDVTTVTDAINQIKIQKAIEKSVKNIIKLQNFADKNIIYLKNIKTRIEPSGVEFIAFANFYYKNKNISFDFDTSANQLNKTQQDVIPQNILNNNNEERKKFLASLKELNAIVTNGREIDLNSGEENVFSEPIVSEQSQQTPMETQSFANNTDELIRQSQDIQNISNELNNVREELKRAEQYNNDLKIEISNLTTALEKETKTNKKNKISINKLKQQVSDFENEKQRAEDKVIALNAKFEDLTKVSNEQIEIFAETIANASDNQQKLELFATNLLETLRWDKPELELTDESILAIWQVWKNNYENVKEQINFVCSKLEKNSLNSEFCEKLNDKLRSVYATEEKLLNPDVSSKKRKISVNLNDSDTSDNSDNAKTLIKKPLIVNENSVAHSILGDDSDTNMPSDDEL